LRYQLREILDWFGSQAQWVGGEDRLEELVRGVSTDTRTLRAGELFVALCGERFDGHQFVEEAFAKGATAAVVAREWAKNCGSPAGPLLVVEDPLRALCHLARCHRRKFSIPVVALTGTVGKTTTKELVAAVLSERFRVLKNEKSFNNAVGVSQTLLSLEPEHEVAVSEIGTNHPGEIAALTEIVEPTMGIILNVGRGHLEFFGDVEGVRREKYELAHWLEERGRGPVLLNADDPWIRSQPPSAKQLVWFGQEPWADVRVEVIGEEAGKLILRFHGVSVVLPLVGGHHVGNAAAAVAVGLHFGLTPEEIARGLSRVKASPHRGELKTVAGLTLVDDTYNCNPESARAACRLLASLEGNRKVAVFGDMLELGPRAQQEHAELGAELAQLGVDLLFGFGTRMAAAVEAARATGLPARHFQDKSALVEALVAEARPGDVILFKGSRAMRMEEVLEEFLRRLADAEGRLAEPCARARSAGNGCG
jgi:UDP-N-acetylmuramoyl-tripeptide--D-alanyl-D-alanine ligase